MYLATVDKHGNFYELYQMFSDYLSQNGAATGKNCRVGGDAPPIIHGNYHVAAELGADERREIREKGLHPSREGGRTGGGVGRCGG